MDIFVQSFDNYRSCSSYSSETASSSNNPSNTYEEVILASSKPKKRAGRRIFKETRHPVYRGVRKKNNKKWVCEVRVPNSKSRRIWLGTYATPEMAARAHDVAALALRGKAACLNFADSAWRLPLPVSADAVEIRRAAAEAAEMDAVEDGYNRPQILDNAVIDYEVCSSETVGVVEEAKKPLIGLCLDEIRGVSEFEDVHDWLRSMAEEPLRSPPPFVRYGNYREWNDVEADAEVSLWSFTI